LGGRLDLNAATIGHKRCTGGDPGAQRGIEGAHRLSYIGAGRQVHGTGVNEYPDDFAHRRVERKPVTPLTSTGWGSRFK